MKREKTIRREKLISDLKNIDARLKFKSSAWNSAIKSAFSATGSFDFMNLAHSDLDLVEELVMKFKLVR